MQLCLGMELELELTNGTKNSALRLEKVLALPSVEAGRN